MYISPGQTLWYDLKKWKSNTVGTCMGDRRDACRVLMGKPERKRLLGRPKHRWEDNVNMDIQEVGCGTWTGLIWLWILTGGGHL
jgi:hypothetical protein